MSLFSLPVRLVIGAGIIILTLTLGYRAYEAGAALEEDYPPQFRTELCPGMTTDESECVRTFTED